MGSPMFGGWTDSARRPMQDAREAMGEVGEAARRGYDDAAHRARQAYGDVSDRAREAYDHVGDYIGPYRQSFEDAIVSNPVKAVGVSLAVGVFLGWLIKRS